MAGSITSGGPALQTRTRESRDNARYSQDLRIAAAEMEAARVCLEAGATPEQAREAAAVIPVLDGLAEAMEQAGAR